MAQSLPLLENCEYTVGWIAALPHERSAAQSMLDEKHAPPSKHPNDENIYTVGSIYGSGGKHNVVIASLPPGRSGPIPAASTAQHMLFSFPNIKLRLLVGIGGGIPSDDNDIRLGDVVVSQPDGDFGGVRQYGEIATIHGFEERGSLNSPPRTLLNAVGALQSKHEMEGSAIPSILQAMCKNYPLMAKPRQGPGYVYQGALNDRLFDANYEHSSKRKECSECDSAEEKSRPERPDQDPYIFYGTIASGPVVIKDARVRDLLSDCLCFETEAAGLMNDFPCLVIRGICDYCDSHKNDRWQRYAAATAAAYAKELLSIVDAIDVRSTSEASTVFPQQRQSPFIYPSPMSVKVVTLQPHGTRGLADSQHTLFSIVREGFNYALIVLLIQYTVQEINSTTQKIASMLQRHQLSQEQHDIYQWLSPVSIPTRHIES